MNDAQTPSQHVDRARELFFMEGREPERGLAPHISRSWQRCRQENRAFDAPAPVALPLLQERREQALRLLECAQPELDGLAEHALGHGCVVILSDARGLILDELGSADFLPKAQRVALTPGVEWSEHSRGTNAIGTALTEREALMVLGGEHFLPQNGGLGCAAAPIFTGRGEIAGVFDISGETVHVNSHALGLVRMAAEQVEHRMMLAEVGRRHVLRFHRRPGLLGTAREGLIVIDDGQIVGANRVALALLGVPWGGLLDQPAERLLGQHWGRSRPQRCLLTLPGGQQVAALVEPATRPGGMRPAAATTGRAEPPDDTAPLLVQATRVLNEGLPVLVTGETGSGKEVFARRLHRASRRAHGPFVAVNCAALPDTLIEAELFGYDEGAFTGARRRGMPGRIREAQGGVLFLDEIGDMPLTLQTRLLRVLEERVVTALGGGRGVAVDFDLVCATHRDLARLSADGLFRSDLLYRVNGFVVELPPLRLRQDRLALIAQLFQVLGGRDKHLRLDDLALARLDAYGWPGNVRELCSVLRSTIALADPGTAISPDQLPRHVARVPSASTTAAAESVGAPAVQDAGSAGRLVDMACDAIDRALADCAGNVAAAAQRLGVHRSTVYRHLAQRQRR